MGTANKSEIVTGEFFFGTTFNLENISCSLSHVHPVIKARISNV